MQKRTLTAILSGCILTGLLSGCGNAAVSAPEDTDTAASLTVFAAASMTESLNEIAEMYQTVAPDIEIRYNFDSSGTLKTQIQEGADCDIFISASQKAMNQLDITADPAVNVEGLDFINEATHCDLLQNEVVLIAPEDSDTPISSFLDLESDTVSLIALGNSDVPVGQYAQEIFENMGIWDALNASGKITFGTNVKDVTTQVAQGAVDCGVVYATDAAAEPKVKVIATAGADLHEPAVYPAAVLSTSKHAQAAEDFLTYLKGEDCAAVFEQAGFTVLPQES